MTTLVLKNAAAANVNFVLMTPAAGDNSLSRWALKVGAIPGAFPTVTALARAAGDGGRTAQGKLNVPNAYTDSTTGLTKVLAGAEFNFTSKLPADFPEAKKDDYVAYVVSLVADALIKSFARDGYPVS